MARQIKLTLITLFTLFNLSFAFTPNNAYAAEEAAPVPGSEFQVNDTSDCSGWSILFGNVECAIAKYTASTSNIIIQAGAFVIKYTRWFVNQYVLIESDDLDTGAVKQMWQLTRNIANGLFGAALLIMAFANMLRINVKEYDIKILLPRFFITILLVNLSWWIARIIIDFSNILSVYLNALYPEKTVTESSIVKAVNLSTIGTEVASNIVYLIFIVVLVVVGMILGLYLMFLMFFRTVLVWILLAISPLAFAMGLLPFTKKLQSTWWSTFANWVFMGPAIMFVLLLAEASMRAQTTTFSLSKLVMVIVFLFAAAMVPQSMGGKLMGTFSGFANNQLSKGKNWAWTGRTDGKGNLGIRSQIPLIDNMRYKSDALHKQAASAQESVAKANLAYGDTGQTLGKFFNNQELVKKAIEEQQTAQKGSNADMMKGKAPEEIRSWIYDNNGNLNTWKATYDGVERNLTAVDLERHVANGTFDKIQFAHAGARKGAGRAGAAMLEARNQGYGGVNAQANFFKEINASHRAFRSASTGTSALNSDDIKTLNQNEEATKRMYQRTADREKENVTEYGEYRAPGVAPTAPPTADHPYEAERQR